MFLKPYSITTYQNTHAPCTAKISPTLRQKAAAYQQARKTSQLLRTPTVLRPLDAPFADGLLEYCVIRFSQALTIAVQYGKIGKSTQATKRKGKHYEGQLPLFNEKRA